MKACIAAIILLSILTGTALWVSNCLTGKTDELVNAAKPLTTIHKEDRAETCRAVTQLWQKSRFLFSLTINRNELDTMDNILAKLNATTNAEGDDEFLIAASELTAAISRIRSICAVSLDNIL